MKTEGIRITIVSLVALVINNCYNRKNIKGLCAYCEVFRSSLQIGLLLGADECLNSSNAKPGWICVAEAARQKVWETARSSTNLQQTTVEKNRREFLHITSKNICPFHVARCKTPANVFFDKKHRTIVTCYCRRLGAVGINNWGIPSQPALWDLNTIICLPLPTSVPIISMSIWSQASITMKFIRAYFGMISA